MSRYYLDQGQTGNAVDYLNNSILSIPKGQDTKEKDLQTVREAISDFNVSEGVDNLKKIESQSAVLDLNPFRNNTFQVQDNYALAELYEAENDIANATKYIKESKNLISKETDVNIKADVYRKSAEYNQRLGRVNTALDDLEKYIDAKEDALQELEGKLEKEIRIVKEQQKLDIKLKDLDLERKDNQILSSQLSNQKWIIGLLSLMLIASVVYFYFLYRSNKEKQIANKKLRLRSLSTQMNPHFIFNALNSVNNFISKNDEKSANKFLSDFSSLMRKVLMYSNEEFISLDDEIELIELYLKLEQFRFRDKLDCEFINNIKEHTLNLNVPPMLVQPFIENAVWHGLRYKEDRGLLKVTLDKTATDLRIVVSDNGIGRTQSLKHKTKNQKLYKSTGMNNVQKRIELLNNIHHTQYQIEVKDLYSDKIDSGTQVCITVPLNNE